MQLTINKPTSRSNQSLDSKIVHHQKSSNVCSALGLISLHKNLIFWQGHKGMKLQDQHMSALQRIEHHPKFLSFIKSEQYLPNYY